MEPLETSVAADKKSSSALARRASKGLLVGCSALLLVSVVLPAAGIWWWNEQQRAAEEIAQKKQSEKAKTVFTPAIEKLTPPSATGSEAVDIDKTIRVIHGLDVAMRQEENLDSWLMTLARQDYRGVAPDVLASRKEILEILQPLYAKQTELEDQQAMWELTSEMMLATLSVVSVSGDVNLMSPEGQFSVDRAQARRLWDDLKERQEDRKELKAEIEALDERLFDAMVRYADTYYEHIEAWDRLSVLRDRAYLAVNSKDWVAAEQSALIAAKQAPGEREAHLIAAMAIIEQEAPERYPEAKALLDEVIEKHPDRTAPALLLQGVLATKQGDTKGARLYLQQSAAYYPKQADALLDMLDPYKMRVFLEKSREGTFIIEMYRSTMLGAGYFSPDLQLARLHFAEGDFEAGQKKVLDHFARRRAQQQWDFVISDISFCQELLGQDFRKIFPEDAWLDLVVSKPMIGSGIGLSVNNRGDKTLHNGTLVLALHLTDMFPGQYSAIPAPNTVPALVAHETTDFGSVDPQLSVGGKDKTVDDIVEHRAILISDEAVVWVDTDAFKIAEAEEFRKARKSVQAGIRPEQQAEHAPMRGTYESLVGGLSQGVDLQIEQKYGKDNVLVTLPRELSILHPVFRLKYGDEYLVAKDNLIEGDKIVLRFPGVENFDDKGAAAEDLELILSSPFGDLALTWKASGQLTWDYRGVKPQ